MTKIKKILITGGAGFLGSMITTSLVKKGFIVTVIDNLYFKKNFINHLKSYKNFKFVNANIISSKVQKKYFKNQDLIIPLAALVGAPLCDKKKKLAKNLNYKVICDMVKILHKDQKIIYPNTNSGYGIGKKNKFCTEKSPLRPISLYGRTKVKAEKCIMKHNNSIKRQNCKQKDLEKKNRFIKEWSGGELAYDLWKIFDDINKEREKK